MEGIFRKFFVKFLENLWRGFVKGWATLTHHPLQSLIPKYPPTSVSSSKDFGQDYISQPPLIIALKANTI